MHFSFKQVETTKPETEHFFGAQAEMWLFGSRVEDMQRGFTLIELIMVMVIVGILAAVVAPPLSTQTFNLSAIAAQLAVDIRATQSQSMSQGQRYRINFTSTSYQITDLNGVAVVLPRTGSSAAISVAPATLSGYNPPLINNYVVFDSKGAPYTDNINPGTMLAANAVITLTSGGTTSTLTIAPQTGRVQ
jgi:prepilin-type N-terminal cleavage/methylation domain-containing protein